MPIFTDKLKIGQEHVHTLYYNQAILINKSSSPRLVQCHFSPGQEVPFGIPQYVQWAYQCLCSIHFNLVVAHDAFIKTIVITEVLFEQFLPSTGCT